MTTKQALTEALDELQKALTEIEALKGLCSRTADALELDSMLVERESLDTRIRNHIAQLRKVTK